MPVNFSNFAAPQVDLVGNEDDGQQGVLVVPKSCAVDKAAGVTEVANTVWYVRFRPGRVINATSIAFIVTTAAGANDNVDVGIYNGVSGARIANAGSTAGKLNAAGVQSVPLTAVTSLQPGQTYYVALGTGALGGTAAVLASITSALASVRGGELFGAAYPAAELSTNTNGIPLAATQVAYSAAAAAPLLAIREF